MFDCIRETVAGRQVADQCPEAVVADPRMTVEAKRELLASWASDARAVVDAPALRRLDGGAVVSIDDILDALKALDLRRPRRDDDDDPPTSPASAMPRPSPIDGGDRFAVAA